MWPIDDRSLSGIVTHLIKEDADRKKSEAFLEARGHVATLLDATDNLYVCRVRHGQIYDLLRDDAHHRGLWRRTPETDEIGPDTLWETVFDIDAYAERTGQDWVWRGPVDRADGRRVLLVLSLGGSDKTVAREFDLENVEFVSGGFETPLARQFLAWAGPDEILIASTHLPEDQTTAGLPRVLRSVQRGAPMDQGTAVFECAVDDLFVRGWVIPSGDGPLRVFLTQHDLQCSSLTTEQEGIRRVLNLPREADKLVTDRFVIWVPNSTDTPQQGHALMRSLDGSLPDRILFKPSEKSHLVRFMVARDCVFLLCCNETKPELRLINLAVPDLCTQIVPLPDNISHLDVSWFSVDPDGADATVSDPRLNILTQSLLTPPTLWRLDPKNTNSTRPTLVAAEKPSFDASNMQELALMARADDGIEIPYRVALPVSACDGPVPVVYTTYGGFGLTVDAGYLRLLGATLVTHGIGCGVAHIRGGGEFGPAWHQAGAGPNKPRTFKDCAAVAEDLVSRGIAAEGCVGFYGGSHGGLVGAVMATRYYEQFRAIHIEAPVTNLLQFQQSGGGRAWIDEFGDPNNPRDTARLQEWSPLHNIQLSSEATYPAISIVAAANDDRVDPTHALQFAAALHSAGHDVRLAIEESGGHGGSGRPDDIATSTASLVSFFLEALHGYQQEE